MNVSSVKALVWFCKNLHHDKVTVHVAGKGSGLLVSLYYKESVFYIDSDWNMWDQ